MAGTSDTDFITIAAPKGMANSEEVQSAEENIRALFDRLPDYQKTLAESMGLEINLNNRGLNEGRDNHSVWHDTPAPLRITLSTNTFTGFTFDPDNFAYEGSREEAESENLAQRQALLTLKEEILHTLCGKLVSDTAFLGAAERDLAEENQTRETLLQNAKRYYSRRREDGQYSIKAPLKAYNAPNPLEDLAERSGCGDNIIGKAIRKIAEDMPTAAEHKWLHELPADIQLTRDYIREALNIPLHRDRLQLGAASVDEWMQAAFPRTYPKFLEYENALIARAEEVKPGRRSGLDHSMHNHSTHNTADRTRGGLL